MPIESVCWSPDGSFYVTTKGSSLLFWDSSTDSVTMEKSNYDSSIITAKISDDGSNIVTIYNDNTFVIEGIKDSSFKVGYKGIGRVPVFDAVFYNSPYTLLVPLDAKNIYSFFCLLATNSAIHEKTMECRSKYIYGLDIDKVKENLLITFSDGSCKLVNIENKIVRKDIQGYSKVSINSKFNRTGEYFFYMSDKNTLKVQSVNDDTCFTIKDYDNPVNTADFSPDNSSLAVADSNGFVKIYNIKNGFVEDVLKLDENDAAFSCEFSPDGKKLLIGTGSGNVVIWQPVFQSAVFNGGSGYGDEGMGNGLYNSDGYGNNGSGSGNGSGAGGSGDTDSDMVFIKEVEKGSGDFKQANIFNSEINAMKIVDLDKHNIYFGAGLGTINSKNFWGNLKIKLGYNNFQLYPIYWGAGVGLDIGFASENFPYEYKINGEVSQPPTLFGIAPFAKGGIHYLFEKIDVLAFAELGIGANIRLLELSGYVGSVATSFFTELGIGAQWKFIRAEFDVQIDTNSIFSVNGTIGCSFKLPFWQ